jgi:hypothetical protein
LYRDRQRTHNELKPAITVYMRNISEAEIQEMFVSKTERVQAWMDGGGHHFQNLL